MFPTVWSCHMLWSHPGTQKPQLLIPCSTLKEKSLYQPKETFSIRQLCTNLDTEENRATEQTLEYTSLHASLKYPFVDVQWEVYTEGTVHRGNRTELFKKTGRFKGHCKLTGFPKLSVQGVIVHTRLNNAQQWRSLLANQRQYRAKLNV